MQTIEEILEVIKNKDTNIKLVSKETGISSDRLYSWRQGRGTPKAADENKLKEWAKRVGDRYNKPEVIQTGIEEMQKELGDVAKGGEMQSMFLMLIEHLQTIAASLSETREIARENNSLVRTVLLNQSKSLMYSETDGAEHRFQASLEVAKKILRQTFSHT
jgi:hypothetical protein